MATTKLGLVTLLLCGIIIVVVVGSQVKHANAEEKACTKECDVEAKYMICPANKEVSKLGPDDCTNCCVAQNRGCILYDHNGTPFCPKKPPLLSPN